MIWDCLLLMTGLLLIIKGGDLFVSSSVRIAEYLRMPRVVIGSTLVSLATTSPEITVSILSGLHGQSGLAVGNALGSCICNLCLVLGVMAALRHVETHPRVLRAPMFMIAGCGLLLFVISLNLRLSQSQGLLLLAMGILYFVYDFRRHFRASRPREMVEARRIEADIVAGHLWLRTGVGTGLVFGVGALMVVGGSKFLVESAVHVAQFMGIPPILIGLTVISLGTSLPEFVTAVSSARRNVSDLAVGNILGANIANLTLVIGSAASVHEVTMNRATQLVNFPALLIAVFVSWHMISSDNRVSRKEGIGLLAFYAAFIALLVGLGISGQI